LKSQKIKIEEEEAMGCGGGDDHRLKLVAIKKTAG